MDGRRDAGWFEGLEALVGCEVGFGRGKQRVGYETSTFCTQMGDNDTLAS